MANNDSIRSNAQENIPQECNPQQNNQANNQGKKKVAILMPAYNQASYIRDALDSLIAQTYENWECAIVDDGSPDDVAAIARDYAARDPRIRFYHTPNRGVSAARNFAASVTSAPYLLPLDADDKFHPKYIESCIREFERNPNSKVVYCKWKFFDFKNYTPDLQFTTYRDLLMANSIFCSGMYRRKDFDRIGGYDEEIPFGFEDWEFWIRLIAPENLTDGEAGDVIQIDRELFYYRIKRRSRSSEVESDEQRKRECFAYIYNKNRDIYHRFFPDMLSILTRYSYLEAKMEKWKRRSVISRLWHAITGRI